VHEPTFKNDTTPAFTGQMIGVLDEYVIGSPLDDVAAKVYGVLPTPGLTGIVDEMVTVCVPRPTVIV
jgi:hypothetical protein